MTDEEKEELVVEWCARILAAVIVAVVLFFIGAAFAGCTRTVYVPITSVQRDSIYLHTHTRDSIMVHDSVTIREKGDTIWLTRWRTEYRDRILRDTAYIERRDTIAVPYPVEKKLSRSDLFFMKAGKVAVPMAVGAAGVIAFIAYRKLRRPR